MKVLFLGGLYPENIRRELIKNSKRGVQLAADNFQHSLIQGFIENAVDISIITMPFLSSFPFGYKKLFIQGSDFKYNNISVGKMISFINIPFLRFKFNNLYKNLCFILDNYKNDEVILVVYSLQQHLLIESFKMKYKYKNVKICLIVADLPEYMSCNKIYKILGFKKKEINYIYNNITQADYYVLLSDYMATKLDISSKNWVRIEGIYNEKIKTEIDKKEVKKTILYSGALHKKYGLDTLLQAFGYIKDDDYQLWLCGDGDYKDQIINHTQKDNRIKYWGILSFIDVQKLQKKATLLINPRTSLGDYTKFSFPSKTMEYLASGTPALLYNLPGIPEGYKAFFYPINEDANAYIISTEIVKICSKSSGELTYFGNKAAEFIKKEKNSKKQVMKILQMFKSKI